MLLCGVIAVAFQSSSWNQIQCIITIFHSFTDHRSTEDRHKIEFVLWWRLGCVRKTFFGPNFSLVGVFIRFGANMPQKKF